MLGQLLGGFEVVQPLGRKRDFGGTGRSLEREQIRSDFPVQFHLGGIDDGASRRAAHLLTDFGLAENFIARVEVHRRTRDAHLAGDGGQSATRALHVATLGHVGHPVERLGIKERPPEAHIRLFKQTEKRFRGLLHLGELVGRLVVRHDGGAIGEHDLVTRFHAQQIRLLQGEAHSARRAAHHGHGVFHLEGLGPLESLEVTFERLRRGGGERTHHSAGEGQHGEQGSSHVIYLLPPFREEFRR